jgi:hypothetical protein
MKDVPKIVMPIKITLARFAIRE